MKEIFDKRYPVTSFFPSNSIGISLDVGSYRFKFERADTLLQFGAMYGPIIRLFPEQIWRLFSAIFVHIGWEHFIVNMISLYFFLDDRLRRFSAPSSSSFSISLSGMMGNLFVFAFTPKVLAAGASTSSMDYLLRLSFCATRLAAPISSSWGQSYLTLFVIISLEVF